MRSRKIFSWFVQRVPRTRIFYISLSGLAISLVLGTSAVFSYAGSNGLLVVDVMDVGQGDGVLIRTPYQQTILIDAGPDRSVERKLPTLLPFFDHTIDLAIVTHPHADHVTGFNYLFDRYRIKQVFLTDVEHESEVNDAFLSELEKRRISSRFVRAGDVITLGPDLTFTILAPTRSLSGVHSQDLNDSSIVAMLKYNTKSFLFTGDAGETVEKELIRSGVAEHADVLKVGHHGSRYGTSEAFLNVVAPEVAVISSGTHNLYGHPHAEILQRLSKQHIDTVRTDQDGDIKITSKGTDLSVFR